MCNVADGAPGVARRDILSYRSHSNPRVCLTPTSAAINGPLELGNKIGLPALLVAIPTVRVVQFNAVEAKFKSKCDAQEWAE